MSVLVLGVDPHRVPGPYDPEPVAAALDAARQEFDRRGIAASFCLVGLLEGDQVEQPISAALRQQAWDCVLIGGGLRVPPEMLPVFEQVVNLVHRLAPSSAIAFNSRLDDIVAAAARHLPQADA